MGEMLRDGDVTVDSCGMGGPDFSGESLFVLLVMRVRPCVVFRYNRGSGSAFVAPWLAASSWGLLDCAGLVC